VELIDDASGIIVKSIKPNFKVLGPKFGKDIQLVAAKLQGLSKEEINSFEREGKLILELQGKMEEIGLNEVEMTTQDIAGWLVASQGNLTVALDVNITNELKNEGIARELVNRIQNIRKDSGLEVTDKIKLYIQADGIIETAVRSNETYIKNETLTKELYFKDVIKNGIYIEFDEIKTMLLIDKV
jgi:isoleucyl-tRNA synthetase